jgi:hypothetical protein
MAAPPVAQSGSDRLLLEEFELPCVGGLLEGRGGGVSVLVVSRMSYSLVLVEPKGTYPQLPD